nr:MAG TPA: hypothetical protein [Caudoviricetes sp.]
MAIVFLKRFRRRVTGRGASKDNVKSPVVCCVLSVADTRAICPTPKHSFSVPM